MALVDDFNKAAEDVKALAKRPTNDELLKLYAFFKQATEGDCSGLRPGLFDLKGRAKFDTWSAQKGLTKDQAMQNYVTLVAHLLKNYR
jgi:acyl-CoA-binding protein